MADEKKPAVDEQTPPAGSAEPKQPAPNPAASDDLQKKIKEMEDQLKERDTKLAEAQTALATIEARRKEVEAQKLKESADADTAARVKRITESMSIDPDTASTELGSLLAEVKTKAAKEAVEEAIRAVQGQSAIDKIRIGIKAQDPDLDDDLVDDIMSKANYFAQTGKYKTADEAVEAAKKYVKGKLETYAQKKNAAPPLPSGARAEGGGANTPPEPPKAPKEVSVVDELNEANEAKRSRLYL